MKAFILLLGVTLTSIVAISNADRNITGTWVMEQGDSKTHPPILHIKMGEGIWEGRIDIPEQQVYDRKIERISIDADSIFLTIYKGGPMIAAELADQHTIRGIMEGEGGGKDPVLLKKY